MQIAYRSFEHDQGTEHFQTLLDLMIFRGQYQILSLVAAFCSLENLEDQSDLHKYTHLCLFVS